MIKRLRKCSTVQPIAQKKKPNRAGLKSAKKIKKKVQQFVENADLDINMPIQQVYDDELQVIDDEDEIELDEQIEEQPDEVYEDDFAPNDHE